MTRPSVLALIAGVAILLGSPCPPLEAGPDPDPACRSLAALYARTPESFDAQDVAALHTCIGAAQSVVEPAQAPVPVPAAAPRPIGPQRVNRFNGDWPQSAPWATLDGAYPNVW